VPRCRQILPNIRCCRTERRCRCRRTYKPFGCAFGARQHSGAARLAGRTCASIVVRLNAAALKAIVSPVIHRIRSTRLVSRRRQLPVLFIGCGQGRVREVVGDADCGRLPWWRGDGPVVGPDRRPPGLLVCLVTGDTGRVSPRPPVRRSPIAWDRAGASCGTRSAARSNRRGSE
jgi:hypothetical protein